MNRKLNFELLEQRNLFAMDSGSTESIASLDSHMTDVGLHGGERTDIADQDESLEPLPPKSLGGTARGTSPVHPFSGSNIQITAAFIADGSGNAQKICCPTNKTF